MKRTWKNTLAALVLMVSMAGALAAGGGQFVTWRANFHQLLFVVPLGQRHAL